MEAVPAGAPRRSARAAPARRGPRRGRRCRGGRGLLGALVGACLGLGGSLEGALTAHCCNGWPAARAAIDSAAHCAGVTRNVTRLSAWSVRLAHVRRRARSPAQLLLAPRAAARPLPGSVTTYPRNNAATRPRQPPGPARPVRQAPSSSVTRRRRDWSRSNRSNDSPPGRCQRRRGGLRRAPRWLAPALAPGEPQ